MTRGIENYSQVRLGAIEERAAARAADPVAEEARRIRAEDESMHHEYLGRLKDMGWECEPTHLYDEEAVEGWRWTLGGNEFTEVGLHDEPAVIPDELLALVRMQL